jgi:hypothetical protein
MSIARGRVYKDNSLKIKGFWYSTNTSRDVTCNVSTTRLDIIGLDDEAALSVGRTAVRLSQRGSIAVDSQSVRL